MVMSGIAESQQEPTQETPVWRVLAVDDQIEVLTSLRRLLKRRGFEMECFTSPVKALRALESDSEDYDLLLLDINMPEMNGLEVLARAKKLDSMLPVVMLTADDSAETAVSALKGGAFNYLIKPLDDPDAVAITLARAGHHCKLLRRTRDLEKLVHAHERFETLVGSTPVMQEVFTTISKLADSDVNVLIQGESGTGKELVARAIHNRSSRRDGPFIALNCGAIPEALIDSELFGHTRGAFTGAVGARLGVFAEANGGTLFLDEIGDIPLAVQLRLLRVLQEGEVRAVGSTGVTNIDVRVVSATHVDLDQSVAAKQFRLDLFYRLNVVNLLLPPLRDRLDDIPLLAVHFLEKHLNRQGREKVSFSIRAVDALCSYDWPGNVRELENAVQRALAMTNTDQIDLPSLPRRVTGGMVALTRGTPPVVANLERASGPSFGDLRWADSHGFSDAKRMALHEFERCYLKRLLKKTDGNISEAARIAGIDRSNLKRVLNRLGLRGGKSMS